jgi:hypothetical protein
MGFSASVVDRLDALDLPVVMIDGIHFALSYGPHRPIGDAQGVARSGAGSANRITNPAIK